MQFGKSEIHTVFLDFPNFLRKQNLSLSALADLIRASLTAYPPREWTFVRSLAVFNAKRNWCSGYRVKTANHPASDCWDATVGAAISRPKPYGFQSTPFCRKRAMIEPFRAADSRPYGSNVRCFHGCCSKPIAYIGVCKDASQVTCHCEPVLRLVWQSPV